MELTNRDISFLLDVLSFTRVSLEESAIPGYLETCDNIDSVAMSLMQHPDRISASAIQLICGSLHLYISEYGESNRAKRLLRSFSRALEDN